MADKNSKKGLKVIRSYNKTGELFHEYIKINGRTEGMSKIYYESRINDVGMVNYCNGICYGQTQSFKNGKIWISNSYYNYGFSDYKQINYHENGNIASIKYYINIKLHGECLEYDKNGVLIKTTLYDNGVKIN